MDFIVSEFINLIKRCSNGLALEKETWRRGIELQCRDFAQALETYDAEMARQYAGKQEVLRIDQRTVLCMFGTVTFARRLVRREGGKPFYPLDNILGLSPYQRYSPLLLYLVTKVAAGSVYRAAAEAVNTLTPLDISHQTVGRMVRTVGDKYAQYEEAQANSAFCSEESLEKPKYLFIEGDGVLMKGQPKGSVEMHRFQVATGVKQNGKRRTLTGLHVIAGFDRKHVLELLEAYLGNHYDLSQCIVLSNSDGGSGYTKDVFDLERETSNADEEENVRKLRAYLERNWECLTPLKNGDLEQALAGDLCRISLKTRKEYRNAVREALKKPLFVPHVGVHQCCIANYGPSSSPMGHLAAVLNW